MLRAFLAGNGRTSYVSEQKRAGAAGLVLLHHILHHLPCTSLMTTTDKFHYLLPPSCASFPCSLHFPIHSSPYSTRSREG